MTRSGLGAAGEALARRIRHGGAWMGASLGQAGSWLGRQATRVASSLEPLTGEGTSRSSASLGAAAAGAAAAARMGPTPPPPSSSRRARFAWPPAGVALLRVRSARRARQIAARVEQAARAGTPEAMDDLAHWLSWVRLSSVWTVPLAVTPLGASLAPTPADDKTPVTPRVSTVVLAMLEAARAPMTPRLFERLLTGEPDAAQVIRTLVRCAGEGTGFGDLLARWVAHDFRDGLASAGPVFLSEETPLLTQLVERLHATPTAYAIAGEWIWSLAESFHPESGLVTSLNEDLTAVQEDFASVLADFSSVFAVPAPPTFGTGGMVSRTGQRGLERAQRRIQRLQDQQAKRRARLRLAQEARRRRAAAQTGGELQPHHWGPTPSASSFTGNHFATLGVLPLFHGALLLLLACPDLPRPLWAWIGAYLDVLLAEGPRGRTVLMPSHRVESLLVALAFHPAAAQPKGLQRGATMWSRWTANEPGGPATRQPPAGDDPDAEAAALRRWWVLMDCTTVGRETLLEPLQQRALERFIRQGDRHRVLGGLKLLLLSDDREVRATALRWVGLLAPQEVRDEDGAAAPEA